MSPLKLHLSFSLTSYKTSKDPSRRSNFFGLFLQSLGVTITDTDDVVFRLAYFERKHQGGCLIGHIFIPVMPLKIT